MQSWLRCRFESLGRRVGLRPKTTIGVVLLFTLAVLPLYARAIYGRCWSSSNAFDIPYVLYSYPYQLVHVLFILYITCSRHVHAVLIHIDHRALLRRDEDRIHVSLLASPDLNPPPFPLIFHNHFACCRYVPRSATGFKDMEKMTNVFGAPPRLADVVVWATIA